MKDESDIRELLQIINILKLNLKNVQTRVKDLVLENEKLKNENTSLKKQLSPDKIDDTNNSNSIKTEDLRKSKVEEAFANWLGLDSTDDIIKTQNEDPEPFPGIKLHKSDKENKSSITSNNSNDKEDTKICNSTNKETKSSTQNPSNNENEIINKKLNYRDSLFVPAEKIKEEIFGESDHINFDNSHFLHIYYQEVYNKEYIMPKKDNNDNSDLDKILDDEFSEIFDVLKNVDRRRYVHPFDTLESETKYLGFKIISRFEKYFNPDYFEENNNDSVEQLHPLPHFVVLTIPIRENKTIRLFNKGDDSYYFVMKELIQKTVNSNQIIPIFIIITGDEESKDMNDRICSERAINLVTDHSLAKDFKIQKNLYQYTILSCYKNLSNFQLDTMKENFDKLIEVSI
eukprot:TRINITY_DN3197_c0_g1_i1.p1 TRINITY_DN3197_c0_g1~~TRINITY_DN3197_c0_g1_i1.p1  ORF type:complete len:401 (-),score=101.17 TRINITY_DN3197_c0_g1_i1:431-1633(-)